MIENPQDKYECLDSPLGRMLFALGVEVVNCGITKDETRLKKVHAVYNSLQALWPSNIKEIYDATRAKAEEDGYDLLDDGTVMKDGKEIKPPHEEMAEAILKDKEEVVDFPAIKVEIMKRKDVKRN